MSIWRFDPFEFDSRSGELTRRGQAPVRLRHKLAQVLLFLLENRERPVGKEELLDSLWQHGDYRERSLTQSIRELRQALGDSASTPVYIRTLPQRGYQWIAKPTTECQPRAPKPLKRSGWRWALVASLALTSLILLGWLRPVVTSDEEPTEGVPSVAIFPFANDTGDPALDWLRLGYADMLAKTLSPSPHVRITPPSTATQLLANHGLQWPTLPVYIQGLLREQGLDLALIASVRHHNRAQVLDFQLIDAEGDIRQGSITYPSLTDASAEVARQLMHLIAPEAGASPPVQALPGDAPEAALARRVLAEGISALQTQGPARANELFQAADLLVKDDPWVTACRAKAQLLTGDWHQARVKLQQLQQRPEKTPLRAFVEYWSAQLAFRRGQLDASQSLLHKAIAAAEPSHSVEILADSYRLLAQIAWQQMDWAQFEHWQAKADRVIPNNANLSIEADRLFYLGNPVGQGLDTYPNEDLADSARLVEQALQFYSELNYEPMIAASELALARNEALSLERRTAMLNSAIERYRALQQPYELTQALIYASYFYLQRHRGELAEQHIDSAALAAEKLSEEHRLSTSLQLYKAFALLDQGLDQSHRGLHGARPDKLRRATEAFAALLRSDPTPISRANALVLQGWGLAALGEHERALDNQREAMALSDNLGLDTTGGYAAYSAMAIHLAKGDYLAVVALGKKPVTTRQQLAYLARAHFELGDYQQAISTQETMARQFPDQWTERDAKRLEQYQRATDAQMPTLTAELPAHAIYCESDWMIGLR